MSSKFCILTTIGPDGTDGSPRGHDGPVVLELDEKHLALPDWRGNNRLDSLRNIVVDGRVSLMFMVAKSNTVVRVNGRAWLTDDAQMCARFQRKTILPATVTIVEVDEIYTQCARALIRSNLWTDAAPDDLPTVGHILAEMTSGKEGGVAYDTEWGDRAAKTMW